MKKIIQVRQQEHVLQLTWVINNICSNHCAYCPPSLHMGNNHHYDWEKAKGFLNKLFKRYDRIHCSISGGEPSLSPFFPELVKIFHDAGHTVGITSNAAKTVRFWEEVSPMLSYICFSYHPSQVDPNFLTKVLAAAKHTSVTIRVMMDSRYWDEAVKFYEEAITHSVFSSIEPVRILAEMADRHIGDEYSEEQLQWIADHDGNQKYHGKNIPWNNYKAKPASNGAAFYYDDGTVEPSGDSNYLISTGQNDFRGWACNIGLESLFIHFDGWVKKGNCHQGGNLFHIDDYETNEFPTAAEICLQNICHCGTDVLISKAKVFEIDSDYVKQKYIPRAIKDEAEYQESSLGWFDMQKLRGKKATTFSAVDFLEWNDKTNVAPRKPTALFKPDDL